MRSTWGRGCATIALVAMAATAGAPVRADTLREALARAYETNPTITASRARQRATDESVPIARAAGRPSASLNTSFDNALLTSGNSLATPDRTARANAAINVPLYTGGGVRNSIRAAETRVEAGQAGLRGTEASLFTQVVSAYNNVIRDEAIVGLNSQNVRVLETNLQATRDRFQVGDLTRTDVAQSEARLSLARAQFQNAQATLISSREDYVRLVGSAPGTLEEPPVLPNMPTSPDVAVTQALSNNPTLLAAQRARDATNFDVQVARSQRLPQVGITGGGGYVNYLGSLGAGSNQVVGNVGQSGTSGSIGLALSVPLFQGGRPAAQVRQAQALRSQAIEEATAAERQVIASTRSAYAIWRSSLQVIQSAQTAVGANRLALEGVRAENSVGTRTILDILDAEQELLNSQVTLVTARRDAYVAGFALLAAMGAAEARDLGLDGGVLYDPLVNYRSVERRYSDFADGPAAEPIAPSTVSTPAQRANVTRALDPMLESKVDRDQSLTTGSSAPDR